MGERGEGGPRVRLFVILGFIVICRLHKLIPPGQAGATLQLRVRLPDLV